MKTSKLRVVIPLCLLVFALVGFVANIAVGTFSAFGWDDAALMCPLGALAAMIATKTIIPRAVVAIVVAAAFILILGRAFCGWLCPVPVISKLRQAFAPNRAGGKVADESGEEGASSSPITDEKVSLSQGYTACASLCGRKRGSGLEVRHFVLVSALLSTLVFGFPVFCLVCPIGLAFGTLFLFANLFMHGDVSWMTAVVPIVLLVETVVFRKWCHALCPLGALMSLVGKGNRTFKITVDDAACLESSKGVSCGVCGSVCPEGIDPRHPALSAAAMSECTKCRACVETCPGSAISMPLLAREKERRDCALERP